MDYKQHETSVIACSLHKAREMQRVNMKTPIQILALYKQLAGLSLLQAWLLLKLKF